MGLSKPIIVNTQEVVVTESAVDLSGIENTLATIQADASAAKTSAAQAAEAAMEGGGGDWGGPISNFGSTTNVTNSKNVTLIDVTGSGYFRVSCGPFTGTFFDITVDGVSFTIECAAQLLYNGSRYESDTMFFKESLKIVARNPNTSSSREFTVSGFLI